MRRPMTTKDWLEGALSISVILLIVYFFSVGVVETFWCFFKG